MAGKLRRGFKADAERLAVKIRGEVGLGNSDRLDPFALAAHLDIPVWPLTEMPAHGLSLADRDRLMLGSTRFSALTIWCGDACAIVFNDGHSSARRASDLAHELAHVICKHPARPAIGFGGCREWDEVFEEEAIYLSGALLVPRDGAFEMEWAGVPVIEAAAHFGTTADIYRMRLNTTGVAKIVSRSRRRKSASVAR